MTRLEKRLQQLNAKLNHMIANAKYFSRTVIVTVIFQINRLESAIERFQVNLESLKLEGSEKQIAWAEDIKAEMLKTLSETIAKLQKDVDKLVKLDCLSDFQQKRLPKLTKRITMANLIKNAIITCTSAKYLIENRKYGNLSLPNLYEFIDLYSLFSDASPEKLEYYNESLAFKWQYRLFRHAL